jgi:hypothetical protein
LSDCGKKQQVGAVGKQQAGRQEWRTGREAGVESCDITFDCLNMESQTMDFKIHPHPSGKL